MLLFGSESTAVCGMEVEEREVMVQVPKAKDAGCSVQRSDALPRWGSMVTHGPFTSKYCCPYHRQTARKYEN